MDFILIVILSLLFRIGVREHRQPREATWLRKAEQLKIMKETTTP